MSNLWSRRALWIVAGAVVVLAALAAGVWYYHAHRVPQFPINSADNITNWVFTGPYSDNAAGKAQAQGDIAKNEAQLGKGQYDDYDLYVDIGNDDTLLGNGAAAYAAYNHASMIHPDQPVVYADLGHLMDLLGASHTAADAYAKAVAVAPGILQLHVERLSFLTRAFSTDTPMVEAALKDASDQFGATPAILTIEAGWLETQGRYADAVKAWQADETLSPPANAAAIETQIARDKAKE